MSDRLGAFLETYEEYLDGKLNYHDLPPSPSAGPATAYAMGGPAVAECEEYVVSWPLPHLLWRAIADWFYWPPIPPARTVRR